MQNFRVTSHRNGSYLLFLTTLFEPAAFLGCMHPVLHITSCIYIPCAGMADPRAPRTAQSGSEATPKASLLLQQRPPFKYNTWVMFTKPWLHHLQMTLRRLKRWVNSVGRPDGQYSDERFGYHIRVRVLLGPPNSKPRTARLSCFWGLKS